MHDSSLTPLNLSRLSNALLYTGLGCLGGFALGYLAASSFTEAAVTAEAPSPLETPSSQNFVVSESVALEVSTESGSEPEAPATVSVRSGEIREPASETPNGPDSPLEDSPINAAAVAEYEVQESQIVAFEDLPKAQQVELLKLELDSLSEISDFDEWQAMASNAIRELAKVDPQAALDYAQAETGAAAREALTEAALEGWVAEDPAGAITYVNNLPPSRGERDMVNDMLRVWAGEDLQAAASFVSSMHPSYRQVEAVWSIAEVFGAADPQGGIAWAATLPPGRQRQDALQTLALSWADVDPVAAVDFAQQSVPNKAQEVAERGAYTLALSDPQAALDFAANQETYGSVAVRGAIDGWSDVDPAAAAQAIGALEVRDQGWAARTIAQKWIREDAPSAAAWASSLEEGSSMRWRAVATVAREYGAADPFGAMEWIDSLPADSTRNPAVSMFSYNAWMADPPEVLKRVETISNEGWRNQNLNNIAKSWMVVDEQAAKAWVSTSSLPDTYKLQLLGADYLAESASADN